MPCGSTGRSSRGHTILIRRLLLATFISLLFVGISEAASISVSSNPSGADIFLNGDAVNMKTNSVIKNVYHGIHYVTLRMPGYRSWTTVIEVDEGSTTYVHHDLVQETGSIVVTTTPTGAAIFVDNGYKGESIMILKDIPVGEHTVLLQLDGYLDYSSDIVVYDKADTRISHVFEPLPTTGAIAVLSHPEGASVYLDGSQAGITETLLENISPGMHTVTLKKYGYRDDSAGVRVTIGEVAHVERDLIPENISATIISSPVNAEILLDGVVIGNTPYYGTFGHGKHVLLFRAQGFEEFSNTYDIPYAPFSLSVELIPAARQIIAEARAKIAENEKYSPVAAKEELGTAEANLEQGEYITALEAAEKSFRLAGDIDDDGIPNALDMQPDIGNTFLYTIPFIVALLIGSVVAFDWSRCRVRSNITVRIDKVSKANIDLILDLVMENSYRAMVCTVSVDGKFLEMLYEPGSHRISLSQLSPGSHTVAIELEIQKNRYGTQSTSQTTEFSLP